MSATNGSEGRMAALATAAAREPREFDVPRDAAGRIRVSAEYGSRTFDLRKMREKLPSSIYGRLVACIEKQGKLDAEVAAAVAHAAKEWAIENGATHFCHWFQPLTGLTAEKHDAFLTTMFGSDPVESFGRICRVEVRPPGSADANVAYQRAGNVGEHEVGRHTAAPGCHGLLEVARKGITHCKQPGGHPGQDAMQSADGSANDGVRAVSLDLQAVPHEVEHAENPRAGGSEQ